MTTANKTRITVAATVNAAVKKVWELWSEPGHIKQWNNASPDWHTPKAENDLREGGKFSCRMEAKDGSFGFDFWGTYTEVRPLEYIAYTMGDGRKVEISFMQEEDATKITETFEAEEENSVELQQSGWQSIMDNFKKYAEAQ